MDKDLGKNSERQLFHGTGSEKVDQINTQGFNRSFCGANGKLVTLYCYGREGDLILNIGKKCNKSKILEFLFTHKRLKGS